MKGGRVPRKKKKKKKERKFARIQRTFSHRRWTPRPTHPAHRLDTLNGLPGILGALPYPATDPSPLFRSRARRRSYFRSIFQGPARLEPGKFTKGTIASLHRKDI